MGDLLRVLHSINKGTCKPDELHPCCKACCCRHKANDITHTVTSTAEELLNSVCHIRTNCNDTNRCTDEHGNGNGNFWNHRHLFTTKYKHNEWNDRDNSIEVIYLKLFTFRYSIMFHHIPCMLLLNDSNDIKQNSGHYDTDNGLHREAGNNCHYIYACQLRYLRVEHKPWAQ